MWDKELLKMGIGKGYQFLGYVIIFLVVGFVLFLVVAFVYDAVTGQLPGSGGGYSEDGGYDGFGRR